jgi:hypothetical protein
MVREEEPLIHASHDSSTDPRNAPWYARSRKLLRPLLLIIFMAFIVAIVKWPTKPRTVLPDPGVRPWHCTDCDAVSISTSLSPSFFLTFPLSIFLQLCLFSSISFHPSLSPFLLTLPLHMLSTLNPTTRSASSAFL